MNVENINIESKRHTLAHILAQAVLKFYPDAKFGIGPAIDNGFYYDFDLQEPLKEEDLPKIEKEMRKIIKKNEPMLHTKLSKEQAKKLFGKRKQPYKYELLEEIKEKEVNVYKLGDGGFVDLCRGPHVEYTSQVAPFKLTSIAGAYWKGDEKRPMLQRIYGVAFESQEELDSYLLQQAEALKRDHRKLGKELKLFTIDPTVGAGLIMWLPRGAFLRKQIMDFALDTYFDWGYEPVATPHIGSLNLWKTSGHWDFYRDSMYNPLGIDEEQYCLKPMNCPFHIAMYNTEKRSYRDLPVKWTEMGTVYRYEKAGQLNGLTRVRGFTQDDAHIICTEDQLEYELEKALDLTMYIFDIFDLKPDEINLSLRDPNNKEKYIGPDDGWAYAQDVLRKVAQKKSIGIVEEEGEAAFYGPKIDIKVKDVLGRKWQLSTIQIDFNLAERFNMIYIDADGKEKRPFMIHRALMGSLERFIAVLIENYGGIFPLWLSLEQLRIIPINDTLVLYAEKIRDELKAAGFRAKVDDKSESMQKKIRNAELEKIPYMLIVGESERSNNAVSVRSLTEKDKGLMSVPELIEMLNSQIKSEKKTN
ncbi:threonine--tRNA ligase [Candidatus Dojkabacteria bacterium]|nr:threonine--tRNA ligase [Candidatus Dojkabacteria bacterium]